MVDSLSVTYIPLVRTQSTVTYSRYAKRRAVTPLTRGAALSLHFANEQALGLQARAQGPPRPRDQPAPAVLRVHQAGARRRGRGPLHHPWVRLDVARRDRRGGAGHQGRAVPPLQRQAGALRGGLRAGGERRVPRDPEVTAGAQGPVGQGPGRAAGLPRGRPGAPLPPDRDPGGAVGPRLRALPRAGGALDVRQRPRDRPGRAQRRHLGPRRGDAPDLRPDLLRGDVLGG